MIKTKINNQYAKKVLTFLAIVLFGIISKAQVNLIPNPSFESNTGIPQNFGEINKCTGWYQVYGTPDYFSKLSPITYITGTCSMNSNDNAAGKQSPRSGDFNTGIVLRSINTSTPNNFPFVHYFEMLGSKLNTQLLKDHVYDFELYYSLAEISGYVTNNFSALFTDTLYKINSTNFNLFLQSSWDSNLNNIKPQVNFDTLIFINGDTTKWHSLNNCFIAKGGEQFLTIGNFKDAIKSKVNYIGTNYTSLCPGTQSNIYSYVYIDDVSLYDRGYYSGKVKTKLDTTICFNTPYVIGSNLKDSATYVWQPVAGLSCTNCPNPIANPSVTTKYTVTKTLCSYKTKDSVTITVYTPTTTAKAGNDYTLCANQNKLLQLGTSDSTKFAFYNWLPNINLTCTNCATPICVPTSDITYVLQRTECNITTISSVNITLEDCETTYTIPNIFTPNNDNVNDVWGIVFNQTRYVKGFYVRVYNRWGTLLFESNRPNQKWDAHTTSGEPVSDGIYFYTLEFTVNDKPINLKGSITLIR
jgi:gliding motility-associated-like protein